MAINSVKMKCDPPEGTYVDPYGGRQCKVEIRFTPPVDRSPNLSYYAYKSTPDLSLSGSWSWSMINYFPNITKTSEYYIMSEEFFYYGTPEQKDKACPAVQILLRGYHLSPPSLLRTSVTSQVVSKNVCDNDAL